MTTSNQVSNLYRTVVDDVLSNVKEAFLDEGVDEQVLQELRQLWESKLNSTKAMEAPAEPESVHMTSSSFGLLMQEAMPSQQPPQQGYVSRAVLSAAGQQAQSMPVSMHQEMSGAAAQATMALPVGLFQQQFSLGNVPIQATANGQYIALQNMGGQQVTFAFPQHLLHQGALQGSQQIVGQQHGSQTQSGVIQLDGNGDGSSSSEDEDFDNDENDDDAEEDQNEDEADQGEEEEPLNSADDVSEEDPTELFDSENVVVCQYDKINRNKNKWKFHLKDGIMNLNGRDFVFQRASGDAEW